MNLVIQPRFLISELRVLERMDGIRTLLEILRNRRSPSEDQDLQRGKPGRFRLSGKRVRDRCLRERSLPMLVAGSFVYFKVFIYFNFVFNDFFMQFILIRIYFKKTTQLTETKIK